MTEKEIKKVNKTARASGAIGKNAVLPKYIMENFDILDRKDILDFGSGPKAIHTKMLRKKGYLVDAYDIGDNFIEGFHINIDKYSQSSYDVIFVSNVMNIQPNITSLVQTIGLIKYLLEEDGIALFNFPKEPRKINLTDNEFKEILISFFPTVYIEKYKSVKIYKCLNW